jgi:hypothetical protein
VPGLGRDIGTGHDPRDAIPLPQQQPQTSRSGEAAAVINRKSSVSLEIVTVMPNLLGHGPGVAIIDARIAPQRMAGGWTVRWPMRCRPCRANG